MAYVGYGMVAFGLDVPYTDAWGKSATGHVSTAAYCGDPKATQQMLKDLGFYGGPVDGVWGSGTYKACSTFAAEHNVTYNSNVSPGGNAGFCQALMDAWSARGGTAPAPTSQFPAGICPAGTVGLAPNCFPLPQAGQPCPPGTMGIAPACFPVPGFPTASQPTPAQPAAPKKTMQVARASVLAPAPAPTGFAKLSAWWKAQSTPVKVGIGLGGVMLLGGIGWLALGGKKAATATPNPRKKRSSKRSSKRRATTSGRRSTRRRSGSTRRRKHAGATVAGLSPVSYRRHAGSTQVGGFHEASDVDAGWTANRGRSRSKRSRRSKSTTRVRGSKRSKARRGSLMEKMRKIGKRCSAKPPARYARLGFTQRSQYFFPECWGYPGKGSRTYTIAAKSKFTRFGRTLPPAIRDRVRRAISRESQRIGLGAYAERRVG